MCDRKRAWMNNEIFLSPKHSFASLAIADRQTRTPVASRLSSRYQPAADKQTPKYYADGTILVNDLDTEVLLSEVSSAYEENNKGKTSFDHHKAMFGLLAMLRTIANLYKYASFDSFKQLKIHFIHTHNRAIRHWTMSTPAPGLYIMNKEQKVDIITDFKQKLAYTVPFTNFAITLGVSLAETMDVLNTLKSEHEEKLEATRYGSQSALTSLLDHVQPLIVRLNESKHMTEVADDGPKSPTYNTSIL